MKALAQQIVDIDGVETYGHVVSVRGLMVEVAGPIHAMSVGARLTIETGAAKIPCEVVGFSGGHAVARPFAARSMACAAAAGLSLPPLPGPFARLSGGWDVLSTPAPSRSTGRGRCLLAPRSIRTERRRHRLTQASGWRPTGSRGACAQHLHHRLPRPADGHLLGVLGAAGLARSVVVVSTSDEPALMRRQAAYLTLAIAEYFRDLGKDVLVLMDSVTRFAMAQREIGLSAGEPPTAKGYTPTVFVELPRLLERAGPGTEQVRSRAFSACWWMVMTITSPVADAVRGILDGHIVMERAIAERGRYPAINVLKSISRTIPHAADPAHLPSINRARQVMATYSDMEELIRLGAYRAGSSAEVDEAITLHKPLEASLAQSKEEATTMADGYERLERILRGEETQN
jgi:flagellum-specific ATP synthase